MNDFYAETRQYMIDVIQNSMKQLRLIMGLGVQELADHIGVTRQTINNLENKKNKLSSTQFIAFCATVDYQMSTKPELREVLVTVLRANDIEERHFFDNVNIEPLLAKWFMCFPDDKGVINTAKLLNEIIYSEDFVALVNNYKIFIDNTTVLDDNFCTSIKPLINALKESCKKVIVPSKVIESLQNTMLMNQTMMYKAREGLKILGFMQRQGVIDIRGEKEDGDILDVFGAVFSRFKNLYRLAIITQSYNLAVKILKLNELNSLDGYNILVLKFNENGELENWVGSIQNTDALDVVAECVDNNKEMLNNVAISPTGWETIE